MFRLEQELKDALEERKIVEKKGKIMLHINPRPF